MTYKAVIVVLAAAIIALLAFYSGILGGGPSRAEQSLKELYTLATQGEAEIVGAEEVSGLYKVTVKFSVPGGQDSFQEVYITKDGALLADRLINIQLQKSLLAAQAALTQCLSDGNVRIIGLSTDATTQAQLQLLGPYAGRLYVDCGGQNEAVCRQLNIQQFPIIFNNGTLVQGPLGLDWFAQNTGCGLPAPAA